MNDTRSNTAVATRKTFSGFVSGEATDYGAFHHGRQTSAMSVSLGRLDKISRIRQAPQLSFADRSVGTIQLSPAAFKPRPTAISD